jgi:hypothetical protein
MHACLQLNTYGGSSAQPRGPRGKKEQWLDIDEEDEEDEDEEKFIWVL